MTGAASTVNEANCRAAMEAWTSKVIAFRYSLGYVKLFEVKFRALEDPRPFEPDQQPVAEVHAPLTEIPKPYDVVVIRHQPIAATIPVVQRVSGMLRYAPTQLLHFYTDLHCGAGNAFAGMSSKTRSTLIRKVRNYEAFCGGAIRWRTYKSPDEMVAFHREARAIATKTYQERLFGSGLPDSETFRAEMRNLAERDLVRGFLLFHEDNPVAYLYTPAPNGFLVYEYLGYDPAYARHSPGTVLQYLALKALYEERRFPLYYWGYGYSQTKDIFSTGRVLAADIYYFRPTIRNRAAVWIHHGTELLSTRIGLILDRLRLKHSVKRWLKRS